MEVHDFDEEHLRAVLKDDSQDEADAEMMAQERRNYAMIIRPSEGVSARLANGEETAQDRQACLERYQLLPEYARNSFLWKESSGDADASGNLQESKNDAPSSSTPEELPEDCQQVPVVEEEKFSLTEKERSFLPEGTITPQSKRLNEMIRMTAFRTASAPQLEVLLKVKQAVNEEFAFLQPGNYLHPYYLLLKERGGKLEARPVSEVNTEDKHNQGKEDSLVDYPSSSEEETRGAMGGLLGMYASSSDDSDNEEKVEKAALTKNDHPEVNWESGERVEGVPDDKATEASVAATNDRPSCTDERKAKRLKRAKLMKGHFALKLMDT